MRLVGETGKPIVQVARDPRINNGALPSSRPPKALPIAVWEQAQRAVHLPDMGASSTARSGHEVSTVRGESGDMTGGCDA